MRLAAAVALTLAACGPAADHFAIDLTLAQGGEYSCPQSACSAIKLSCDAIVSLRIVDAVDPSIAYVSKCVPVKNADDLCAIGAADLGQANVVPNRMVRVEFLVWPAVDLPDQMCPTNVQFDAQGMPEAVVLNPTRTAPALGGQTYFQTGTSDAVEVALGCLDLGALDSAACNAAGTVSVHTSIDDFDTGVSLPVSLAQTVTVSVGEPKARTNPQTQQVEWEIAPTDTTTLDLDMPVVGPVPTWSNKQVMTTFQRAACVQVLEDGTQETPAITCHAADKNSTQLDLRAFRLAKSTLAQAYSVLRLPGVPDAGLVVGMVVDADGNPVAGVQVVPSTGTVQFLSADRMAIDPGSLTTESGMFVSRDVPFDATWAASDSHGNQPVEKTIIGGLVVGKATIIFLQLAPPPSNP